ncbi:MAG: bifunctional DNA-formamidopyrimidine glycosylase/DNA-(apurinic or apyrimidinic site) lyase [candidate division WS1 bacterium]|nr:bifunctional DNA-formamidopyrimidine glycosylase/DNA-(apurinic or apyrimidinic site) lyase [candidate division WS1 bacterium]
MPELPEVETIRRGLQDQVVGDTIVCAHLRRQDIILTPPEEFLSALEDRRIIGTGRHGKALWLALEDHVGLGIHLRMSGQFKLVPSDSLTPKHTHLVLELAANGRLIFVDPRRFGRLELLDTRRLDQAVLLRRQGPDALSEQLTREHLLEAASHHSIAIKQFLLDQSHVAGIGNIYACEILHLCRLHPDTPANRVTANEMARLLEATRSVLTAAVQAGGTTLADAQYQTLNGKSGEYQHHAAVYAREDEPCVRRDCRGRIRRYRQAGRSTYLCPVCQASGRGRKK